MRARRPASAAHTHSHIYIFMYMGFPTRPSVDVRPAQALLCPDQRMGRLRPCQERVIQTLTRFTRRWGALAEGCRGGAVSPSWRRANASSGRCKGCQSTVGSRPKNRMLKVRSGARNTDAHSVYPPLGGPRRGAAGGRFHRHGGVPTRHPVDVRAVQAPWGPGRRMGCLRSGQEPVIQTLTRFTRRWVALAGVPRGGGFTAMEACQRVIWSM